MFKEKNQRKQNREINTVAIKKLKGKASVFTQGSVGMAVEILTTYFTYYD